jgi:hypothetical protein
MPKVLQRRPSADEQLTDRLVAELHRVGMKVQTSVATEPNTGQCMVNLLAIDQTTGDRFIATGHDWDAAATELGRKLGVKLRQ